MSCLLSIAVALATRTGKQSYCRIPELLIPRLASASNTISHYDHCQLTQILTLQESLSKIYPENMSSNVLASRDTNVHLKAGSSPDKKDEKPKTLEYHRQVLESRLQHGQ